MALDYAVSSVAADLGAEPSGISRLFLRNSLPQDRLHQNALDIYAAGEDGQYSKLAPVSWRLVRGGEDLALELSESIAGRYIKVHSKFDDRDEALNYADKSSFRNSLGEILSVEQILDFQETTYEYDALGNRTRMSVKLLGSKTREYKYYANSNRLLTDGKFAYAYDANGNLLQKGNRYELVGENLVFTTAGEGVLYWEYGYDLANRLIEVKMLYLRSLGLDSGKGGRRRQETLCFCSLRGSHLGEEFRDKCRKLLYLVEWPAPGQGGG